MQVISAFDGIGLADAPAVEAVRRSIGRAERELLLESVNPDRRSGTALRPRVAVHVD